MKPLPLKTLLLGAVFSVIRPSDGLLSDHKDQDQQTFLIAGEAGPGRVRREAGQEHKAELNLTSVSVFPLNNSHLHLMVHWAGKGSNVVFCLTRDPVRLCSLIQLMY